MSDLATVIANLSADKDLHALLRAECDKFYSMSDGKDDNLLQKNLAAIILNHKKEMAIKYALFLASSSPLPSTNDASSHASVPRRELDIKAIVSPTSVHRELDVKANAAPYLSICAVSGLDLTFAVQ
jgi:hypothetical protein